MQCNGQKKKNMQTNNTIQEKIQQTRMKTSKANKDEQIKNAVRSTVRVLAVIHDRAVASCRTGGAVALPVF